MVRDVYHLRFSPCLSFLLWQHADGMAVLDTCIGYNSLYVIPNVETTNGKDLPDGKRLWSWLILFDDGEKIALTEYLEFLPY